MELEEMKERWAALNDRLERTEMLQESVIRELVQTKGEKSVSRLINWETFGFVVTILIIPYSIYVYHRFGGHFAMWDLFSRVAIVVDGLLVLWTGYKLYGLMKIDFTKVVKEYPSGKPLHGTDYAGKDIYGCDYRPVVRDFVGSHVYRDESAGFYMGRFVWRRCGDDCCLLLVVQKGVR